MTKEEIKKAIYHVQDCSTDHCPRCGEVLNQCTCKPIYQRVDFGNKELEAENERLEAQLEKAKCCGSCKWWSWVSSKSRYHCEGNEHENYTPAGKLCDKWEVRE